MSASMSKRKYKVVEVYGTEASVELMSLKTIMHEDEENNPEVVYALQEMIDTVLNLDVGESVYFQPDRSSGTSKGIIVRIS